MLPDRLHLGCGTKRLDGYLNVDIVALPGVTDQVFNLEVFPYPWESGAFKEILLEHVLEHLSDTVGVMRELHRLLSPGGIIRVSVPYFSSPNMWGNPTHKRQFGLLTFNYLAVIGFTVIRRRVFFFSVKSFMRSRWYALPIDVLLNVSQAFYARFLSYLLPVSELHAILQKVR